jgi:PAS domain S-box-containing protein
MIKAQISQEQIDDIAKFNLGSFCVFRFESKSGKLVSLQHSPDRPAFTGRTEEEYEKLDQELSSFVLKDDIPVARKAIDNCISTQEDTEVSFRLIHKTKGTAWVYTVFRFLGFNGDDPIILASFINDSVETRFFSAILDDIKTIIVVIDFQTRKMLYANKAAINYNLEKGGYSNEYCYKFMRQQSDVCPWCNIGNLKKGESVTQEIIRPDKSSWQMVTSQRTSWGGHDAVIQCIDDINDYKLLQKKLESQKEELQETISSIPVGIALYHKSGDKITRTSINSDVTEIKGVSEKELMKDSFLEIFKRVWPDDKERVIQDTKDVFTKGHTVCIYRTMNQKTGKYLWMHREGRAVTHPDGTQTAYFCYTDISQQMEMEIAYKEAHERYLSAVKGGNIAVWEYSLDDDIITSPEHSLGLMGLPDTIKNPTESLKEYFLPVSWDDIAKQLEEIKRGIDSTSYDFWGKGPNGHQHCFKVTYTVLKDSSGKPIKALGVAQDITVQKRIEEEYSRSAQDFLAINPNALCSFRMNLTKDICYQGHGSSTYIKRILSSDTATGFFKNLMTLIIDDDDIKKAQSILKRSALIDSFNQGRKNQSLTYRRIMENGERHWVTTYISLIKNPNTEDIEGLLYSVDSNEAMREKLIDSRITNDAYDFIALINVNTGVIKFQNMSNHSVLTTPTESENYDTDIAFGLTQKLGAEANKVIPNIKLDKVIKELTKTNKYTCSFRISQGEGSGQVKLLSYTYLDASHQDILFFRTDITAAVEEEKKQSEALQAALDSANKANQLKTDFLSNVSHDMRTPLNGVIGYTDLALESDDSETIRDYLRKIKRSGEMLTSLINDTLDLSKIENGQVTITKTPIPFEEFIDKISTSIQPSMDEKNLHFTLDTSKAALCDVNVDVIKLSEVINNLLSNAIKFTPEGGNIRLAFETISGNEKIIDERITVADDGIGMTDSFQAKAFEPFTQERTKKNADVGGSGLGLSIVKKLVRLMDGEIKLKSKLGQGTTITIDLPLERVSSVKVGQKEEKINPSILKGKKILLVEDNLMNIEIAKAILEMNDIIVEIAENGQESIDKFSASPIGYYDAILMDIRMPVMNGFVASANIRALKRPDAISIPIIAMTADAYEDDIKRCLEAGMNSHISKPIDRDQLSKELCKYISAEKK